MKTTLLLVAALCILPLFVLCLSLRGSARLTCRVWQRSGEVLDHAGLTARP